MTSVETRARELRDQYQCGDIDGTEFGGGLVELLAEQLVWISDLESGKPMDWGQGTGDVAALWRLATDFGYLDVAWEEVRDDAPLRGLFNAVMAQEVRDAASMGSPVSLLAALMQSVALIRTNGVAFPDYGAPITLPNSDWLSEDAFEWIRRWESASSQNHRSSMDAKQLNEPLRSEVTGYLKANGLWQQ